MHGGTCLWQTPPEELSALCEAPVGMLTLGVGVSAGGVGGGRRGTNQDCIWLLAPHVLRMPAHCPALEGKGSKGKGWATAALS